MSKKLFYIDPQSYFNLEVYDSSLLTNIKDCRIVYYHSVLLERDDVPGVDYRLKQKFGLSCFAFDRSLSYQHLAERRTPSFEYEQHIVDANVRLYQKKGFDKHIILKHFRQNAILQLWKERLISPHGEYKQILQRLILYINNQFSS